MNIMPELLYFAIFYIVLALILFYRLAKGPSVVDRAVVADSMEILTDVALVLFALYSGRGIYLDVAVVTAMLGFVGTVLYAKYLEGAL